MRGFSRLTSGQHCEVFAEMCSPWFRYFAQYLARTEAEGGSLVGSSVSRMVQKRVRAGSPRIGVDNSLKRNSSAGLTIRTSRPAESALKP